MAFTKFFQTLDSGGSSTGGHVFIAPTEESLAVSIAMVMDHLPKACYFEVGTEQDITTSVVAVDDLTQLDVEVKAITPEPRR